LHETSNRNTVAKQKILVDLMELLLKTMEEEYGGAAAKLDDDLTEITDDDSKRLFH
jgi:hypothetical protein